MSMLRNLAASLWMLMLAWAEPAQAQFSFGTEAPGAIFTVDQEMLFQETLFGQRLAGEIQAAVAALNKENDDVAAALKAKEEALTEQRKTMDNAEFRLLAAAFDQEVVAVRDAQRAKERELAALSDQLQQFFQTQTTPIIQAVLKERNVGVLVDSRAVIWVSPVNDLTTAIITRIDDILGEGPTP